MAAGKNTRLLKESKKNRLTTRLALQRRIKLLDAVSEFCHQYFFGSAELLASGAWKKQGEMLYTTVMKFFEGRPGSLDSFHTQVHNICAQSAEPLTQSSADILASFWRPAAADLADGSEVLPTGDVASAAQPPTVSDLAVEPRRLVDLGILKEARKVGLASFKTTIELALRASKLVDQYRFGSLSSEEWDRLGLGLYSEISAYYHGDTEKMNIFFMQVDLTCGKSLPLARLSAELFSVFKGREVAVVVATGRPGGAVGTTKGTKRKPSVTETDEPHPLQQKKPKSSGTQVDISAVALLEEQTRRDFFIEEYARFLVPCCSYFDVEGESQFGVTDVGDQVEEYATFEERRKQLNIQDHEVLMRAREIYHGSIATYYKTIDAAAPGHALTSTIPSGRMKDVTAERNMDIAARAGIT
jgi:hypothetical protein